MDRGVALPIPTNDVVSVQRLFPLTGILDAAERYVHLQRLQTTWEHYDDRRNWIESEWVRELADYLDSLVNFRSNHVRTWLEINTARFKTDEIAFQALKREFESLFTIMKSGVQLCTLQCTKCHLLCLDVRHHDSAHSCNTSHSCTHACAFKSEHPESGVLCGLP